MAKFIDPPEGWKYGFPKVLPDNIDNISDWLVEQGYPKEKIASYGIHFYCRYWETENET